MKSEMRLIPAIALCIALGLALSLAACGGSGGNNTSPSSLSDTGLTTCYDASGTEVGCAGTGQDGEYSTNPMSFSDHGDGTVTDNVTGLMWQKCSAGQTNVDSCRGAARTYTWYEATGTTDVTYNPGAAVNVCDSLDLGGHKDWRLPNEMELMSIANYGTYGPAIDAAYFPNTDASEYWSSTGYASSGSAWVVHFNYGYVSYGAKSYSHYVRCVRGQYPMPSFTDNRDGTVTDNNTGLMWQQEDDDTTKSWQQALDYCNGLELAGNQDWRLPNAKELRSIVDSSVSDPAINTFYFPSVDAAYWSSTTHAELKNVAWFVSLYEGYLYYGPAKSASSSCYVQCVR